MSPSPIDVLFAPENMKCTLCGVNMKIGCDCWTKCSCGWSFEKGTKCRNPKCGGDPDNLPGVIATGKIL